jgi:hypothetical protein
MDWTGLLYCGHTIKCNCNEHYVDISMPGYVDAAIHKFQHPRPNKPEDAPHQQWNKPVYGTAAQYAPPPDTSALLDLKAVTRIQQILGTFLYYAIAVDSTMLVALGTLASQQTTATANTAIDFSKFLDCAATHPNATVRYYNSDMILHLHSDTSSLSEKEAKSRAGRHFFLSSQPTNPTKLPLGQPPLNGAIHTTSKILRNVMASAAEAEVAGLFLNAQEAVPIQTTLTELGHPQPLTPIQQANNSTATGFANNTIKQKRSKAMDMCFTGSKIAYAKAISLSTGADNLADYQTKHHSASHHHMMRPTFLHQTDNLPLSHANQA